MDEIPYFVSFDGSIPQNAKIFGSYKGQNYFIGRAHHNLSLTPGIVLEREKVCLIPWGTITNRKIDFEILVGGSEENWVVASEGNAPLNAFVGGHSEQGESLFIGRYRDEGGDVIVGKIQPSHHVCYITCDELEKNSRNYEVFVI